MTTQQGGRSFEIPHAATYILLIATIAVSGLCFLQSGSLTATSDVLARFGSMNSSALPRHEYWRLLGYGFLHADFPHIAGNMVCLVLWGGQLEKRVGSLYFLIIYFAAMVFGAVIGDVIHPHPYSTVGASGAIAGILGGLMALWLLGRPGLTANFFLSNIALSIVITFASSRINWQIHLGGLVTGFIVCLLLNVVEKANALLFRCKFPEFAKINIFALICLLGILLWAAWPPAMTIDTENLPMALAGVGAGLVMVKIIDIVLSLRKGLAMIVILFAMANAAMVLLVDMVFGRTWSSLCASYRPGTLVAVTNVVRAACSNPTVTAQIVSGCVFAITLLFCAQELRRGFSDVGFVGSSLRAERNRRQGI